MLYVAQVRTRSRGFLAVLEALRAHGRIGSGGVIEASGDSSQAKELIRLMTEIRFAEFDGGILKATALANSKPTPEQLSKIEDYLLGKDEASDFRILLSALSRPEGHHEDGGDPMCQNERKVDVDPETVRRYAKDFLDVSDIASKQRLQKVDK
jgi:hypothetical protein